MTDEPISQVDALLTEVTVKQMTWKPSVMRNIAVHIVQTALALDAPFYADRVDLSDVQSPDVNCIGATWKNLTKAGILERTGHFRRSTKKPSHGRTIWEYRIASRTLARTFLKRNQVVPMTGSQWEFNLNQPSIQDT